MSTTANAAAYRRWFDEGCSQGNVNLVDELYSPGYLSHSLGPDLPPTREGLKQFVRAWHAGAPDVRFPMADVVAADDRVAGRFRAIGTHTGTLFGIPATGKTFDIDAMVIARFDAAGKWVEDWATIDQLGMLRQLGVIPEMAAV